MEIKYLKTYNENKDSSKFWGRNTKSKTTEEIQELETLFNNGTPFPKAFREFLFIGGNFNAIGLETSTGNYKGLHQYYEEGMAARGLKFNRPFMVFHNFEGAIGMFIYLDEGDDPKVYNCSVSEGYDSDNGEILWKSNYTTFKELIDDLVNSALNGLQPW